MLIKSLASGSSGNCYLIDDGATRLLIEVGISWKRIREALGFETISLSGVLVSHGHGDHSGHAKEALKAGIDVYASAGAIGQAKLEPHHRLHAIRAQERCRVGSWVALPFDTTHDADESLGFVLGSTATEERLLYLTDAPYSEYRFEGLTHVMLEANYSPDVLTEKILSGALNAHAGRRIRRNHMSIDTAVTLLKANDLSACREIHLLHLSDGNSDERQMKLKVQQATGIPTYIC